MASLKTDANMRFKALVPMLQTDDMKRTREWYESLLGFRCVSAEGDDWCRLIRDDIAIMFMRNDHLGPPHATATQYIYVDDVMAVWDSIKDRCSAEWGPEKRPYGMLEFAIKDPNGYLLSFGQQVT
jgi:catechol 2,3-dioxygenase-like lactoylglutathione lyase family enzyme